MLRHFSGTYSKNIAPTPETFKISGEDSHAHVQPIVKKTKEMKDSFVTINDELFSLAENLNETEYQNLRCQKEKVRRYISLSCLNISILASTAISRLKLFFSTFPSSIQDEAFVAMETTAATMTSAPITVSICLFYLNIEIYFQRSLHVITYTVILI